MTPEDEFVFRLLQRVGNPQESDPRLETIAESNPDWNEILKLALQHGLGVVFRRTIADIDADPPSEIVRMLDERYRENSLHNLKYSRQLHEICDLFDANEITALPYKGPVLAEVAHGGVGDRTFVDLDFLVSENDIKAACECLERRGYERVNFADIPVETLVEGTVFRWGKEFRFVDPRGGPPIELRFGFIGGRRSDAAVIADLWERRTTTSLGGRTVSALSSEDRALLLLVHGTKHGWRQLSWVYDIAQILQQDIDWETVLMRAEQYRWQNAIIYGLAVTAELTELSVPEPIRSELDTAWLCSWGGQRTVAHLQANPNENLQYLEPITTAMFLNDDLLATFIEGAHELIAPRKADYELIPLPATLYPLYYVVRAYRLSRTKTKQLID